MLHRVLGLVVVLLIAAPAAAQAFEAPQLFYRQYLPGKEAPWKPLRGAIVDVFEPEIGVLVGADPAGKDPGAGHTVTKVPDHATADTAFAHPGLCFPMPGFAGKIDPLGQLQFRGFGAYSIRAVAETNAQAMASIVCDPAGLVTDIPFTVRAAPRLRSEFKRVDLDNDSYTNAIEPILTSFAGSPADYACARNAHAGADGTPSGTARFTVAKVRGIVVAERFHSVGRWSCAARFEAKSEGDQRDFTGPWGPIFSFDVTNAFAMQTRLTPLGGLRYKLAGLGSDTGPGAKVRVTITPGIGCPPARAVHATMAIAPTRRFSKTITLPEHGSSGYVLYGWRVKLDFLGTRFLRPVTVRVGAALSVRSSGGQPRYRAPQVAAIDFARAGCVRQPIFHPPG